MNVKQANRLFLVMILIRIAVSLLMSVFPKQFSMSITQNYLFSELLALVPALIAVFLVWEITEKKKRTQDYGLKEFLAPLCPIKKNKISTYFLIILFTMLLMPFISLANIFSQFFVKNSVAAMSSDLVSVSFGTTFFFVGVYAPVCEELICRGILFGSSQKSTGVLKAALLSGLMFGILHLNFNQMAYAVIMGVAAAFLVKATGNIFASIWMHMLINGPQVIVLYLLDKLAPGTLEQAGSLVTMDAVKVGCGVYLLLTVITLPLAAAVLTYIADREQGMSLSEIWQERNTKKDRVITFSLVITLVLSIIIMLLFQ